MDSCLFKSKWSLLLAAAVLMAVSSSEAQKTATNAWQSIIFSSPGNTEISSNLMSHPAQPSSSPGFQGRLRVFQGASPATTFDNLPAGPVPMPGQVRRSPKSSDDGRDWIFMTPAEIMGVAPGQILQTQKRGANGDQGSLTPTERFLEGQNSSAQFQTNSSDNSSPERVFWADAGDQTNDASYSLVGSSPGNLGSTIFGPAMKNEPSDNLVANPNRDSVWSKLFGPPSPSPAPNPASQQAEIDQFKQLLNPGSVPVTTTLPSDKTTFSQLQTILPPSDDSTEPLANPIGASFVPLSSGIIKPTGLAPLPTITRQASAQPVAPPSWAPQPPPWLSPTPQLFTIPQTKF